MITLSIRYTLDPNKIGDFKTYAEAEQEPICRSGGKIVGYFLPRISPGQRTRHLA